MMFSQASVMSNWSDAPAFLGVARSKIINDPIHGHVLLDQLSLDIIDTPQFQRLRDLKQLGSAYFVFPGASHNRFEHSVGTCHLAGKLLGRFRVQQPELDITDTELQMVRIAGLCHDIGHGPFSHVFDHEFIPRSRPGVDWSHEDMSLDLLDWLVDDNNIDIERADLQMVKDCIIGSKRGVHTERSFLYEIVANGRNSIDVDKFDYLARDTYNIGMKSSYDFERLMNFSRVINDEICYHSKEVFNLYEMYHTRYSNFKQVYSHRASKAIEYMITDAMLQADAVWKGRISNAIDDPKEYSRLTDCILREIEFDSNPSMLKAQRIIRNIRKRRLYRLADEMILPVDLSAKMKKVTAADIAACNEMPTVHLRPSDIVVHDMKLNYTNKNQDPVTNVRFFRDWEDTESFAIKAEDVSYLLPTQFEERIVRAFCKSSKEEKLKATQLAFRAYMRKFRRGVTLEAAPTSRVWASPDKRARSPDMSPAALPPPSGRDSYAAGAGAGAGAGSGSGGGGGGGSSGPGVASGSGTGDAARRSLWTEGDKAPTARGKKTKASGPPRTVGGMERFLKRPRT